jgi:hypothetical protein
MDLEAHASHHDRRDIRQEGNHLEDEARAHLYHIPDILHRPWNLECASILEIDFENEIGNDYVIFCDEEESRNGHEVASGNHCENVVDVSMNPCRDCDDVGFHPETGSETKTDASAIQGA